jgi:hypothetical protein
MLLMVRSIVIVVKRYIMGLLPFYGSMDDCCILLGHPYLLLEEAHDAVSITTAQTAIKVKKRRFEEIIFMRVFLKKTKKSSVTLHEAKKKNLLNEHTFYCYWRGGDASTGYCSASSGTSDHWK